ncbi:PIG-L family deacetylase [Actinomycetospora endophytica]|uniref:PIG-L family deacetylase n=1 Tax=Actinomycetospora endophytica TaxID=2291215 RepID=A0ABS8P4R6_9PSEU|nr:PIG-L family deacetylase [Actinomycetospora endophytica]MCD2193244.1 PIG-L family deacetylase [Actinomycetospora endophytica]
MATLVTFHAHPDDECIACGGVMRAAADAGHRVVLVVATGGEHGEIVADVLAPGQTLAQRRHEETLESARILGVARTEFLGYVDSGMVGTETNTAPGAFAAADVEEAAGKLAVILRDEAADVVTVYDDHGGYGHPDHVQVHHVGMRAAEIAGTPRVFQSTMNRDEMRRLMAAAAQAGLMGDGDGPDEADLHSMGTPESDLTTRVDVTPWIAAKRDAMRAHSSQIAGDSFFLALPDEAFASAFGTEWFLRPGAPAGGPFETDLFSDEPSRSEGRVPSAS